MAFSELDLAQCKRAMDEYIRKHRPPGHSRSQIDLAYRIDGQSIEIYEIMPHALEDGKTMEDPAAKATYIRSTNQWRVYWKRANGRWFSYEPSHTVHSLAEFIAVVERDEHACFFG